MKLICTNDKGLPSYAYPLFEGNLYTHNGEFTCSCGCGNTMVKVIEIPRDKHGHICGYDKYRFEPYTGSVEQVKEILEHEMVKA